MLYIDSEDPAHRIVTLKNERVLPDSLNAVYMSYMSQSFRFLRLSDLSLLNYRV